MADSAQDKRHIADYVRQLAAFEQVLSAVAFYGDHESYHAIAFLPDPPCGEFWEDFEEDHGHPDYDRPMPGKRARAALRAWSEAALKGSGDGHVHPPVPPDDSFCEHGVYYEMPCSRCAHIDGADDA